MKNLLRPEGRLNLRKHADQETNLLRRIKNGPLRVRGYDSAWVIPALRRLVTKGLVQRNQIGYILTPDGWSRVKELERAA